MRTQIRHTYVNGDNCLFGKPHFTKFKSGRRANPLDGKSSRHEDMARPDAIQFAALLLIGSTRSWNKAFTRARSLATGAARIFMAG